LAASFLTLTDPACTPFPRRALRTIACSVYEGGMLRGLRHGEGVFRSGNGQLVYEGSWVHGKRDGQGSLQYGSNSIYVGSFVDNNRQGNGRMVYNSGNIYDGEWRANVRHGEGVMAWKNRNERYSGSWKDGEQDGQGEYVWFQSRIAGSQYPTRNRYKGAWLKGMRHGKGTFFYANGAVYDGEWMVDKKQGSAVYTFENGYVHRGEFKADEMVAEVDSRAYQQFLFEEWAVSMEGEQQRQETTGNSYDMERLRHCTLRHISDLLSIYSFYSSMGCTSADNTYTMNRLQFHRFLKDSKVGGLGLSMCEADRIIHTVSEGWSKHAPLDTLLPRHFLVAITRVAYHLFGSKFATSGHPYSACLQWFLDHFVLLQWHNVDRIGGYLYKQRDVEGVVPFVFDKLPSLCELYDIYSASVGDDDAVLTARECLQLMNDLSLLQGPGLTSSLACGVMKRDNPMMTRDGSLDMRVEMSHLEMIECFVGCALIREEQRQEAAAPAKVVPDRPAFPPGSDDDQLPGDEADPDSIPEEGDDGGAAAVTEPEDGADAAAADEALIDKLNEGAAPSPDAAAGNDAAAAAEREHEHEEGDDGGGAHDGEATWEPATPIIFVVDDGSVAEQQAEQVTIAEDQILPIISAFIQSVIPCSEQDTQ